LVAATAWTSSTILDPAKHGLRARGEQQVQRLGRGDEGVGRRAAHRLALALALARRRVAGAQGQR
jgi:hypothetical protein